MEFTKQVYENIKNSIADTNTDELLEEAEAILEELEARDFSEKEGAANQELQNALECKIFENSFNKTKILSKYIRMFSLNNKREIQL